MKKPQCRQSMEDFAALLSERELILYGCSKEAKALCRKYPVKCMIDRNDELCDVTVEGVRIYTPDRLYLEEPDRVIILVCAAERYLYEITQTIQNIADFMIFYWPVLNSRRLSDISCALYDNYAKITALLPKLYDDYSRKVLTEVVVRRMAGIDTGYDDLKIDTEVQYMFFPALCSKAAGAVLDCGGYIGDTIDRFIGRLGNDVNKIYTFEALPDNVAVLRNKGEGSALGQSLHFRNETDATAVWHGTIEIVPMAVADKRGKVTFYETAKRGACFSPEFSNASRYAAAAPVNVFEVETVSIDEIIPENEAVRYIKMDIEGAEYEALLGAEKTIVREKPGLAVSIYHNAEDYYRLAELILRLVPEYKLAVRHHKDRHVDTVLYAWI